jgi:hypothetical protein
VSESGEVGRQSEDPGDDGSEVDAVEVAVDSFGVVELPNVDFAFADDVEVGGENRGDGCEEDGVAARERSASPLLKRWENVTHDERKE